MKVLVLTHAQVEELLPVADCIGVMEGAFRALAEGDVFNPLRMMLRPEAADGNMLAVMPAFVGGEQKSYGVKVVAVYHDNPKVGKDAHQGFVSLFHGETGEPLAFCNAAAVTAIRTAAVSGLATRLLSRPESKTLALVGTGTQARYHLPAIAAVRNLERVRVASARPEKAAQFVAEMQPHYPFPIEAAPSVEAAVTGADLIVTVTSSKTPVVERGWVAPGAHICAVGTSVKTSSELPPELVAACRMFVDRKESAKNEAGEYLNALAAGAVTEEHIVAEVGDLVTGRNPGRRSFDEITLFKSLGLAMEDVASARYLYARAQETGKGSWVDF
jgi:ornithine cyclodeaminase/alanine dehydrogenase-like protein (mu-crystallin family)